MGNVTLADLLRPFGIASPEDFAKWARLKPAHAKKVYAGVRPISRAVANRLKTKTNGSISIDALYGVSKSAK